ncbi:MAG: hypothetical protein ACRDD7_00335, partial [Peptostreptococcaceae bacterium]
GDIFQLYDLIFSLPRLDYKITTYDKTSTYEKDMIKIRQSLERKINYKKITRDLLIQEAHEGTVIGTWLGGSNNAYFYTFNDLEHVFPYGNSRGKMTAVFDLKMLEKMKETERIPLYENLKPLVTKAKFEKWKNTTDTEKKKELQYILLPTDKTLVARSHTLYSNQRYGLPFGTQALFDIVQKQKMKELERSIADKVIKAIAILKFKGKDDNDNKVSDTAKSKVFQSVKQALTLNNNKDGLRVIAIPDFAEYQEGEFKGVDEALDPKKYESIDDSISNATGLSRVLTNGTKGNFASAKLNLDTIYQKIAVMLEDIEEVFNQYITIILGEKKGLNYKFEFNKEAPLSKKEKIDVLVKLQAQGFSVKYVLDELGINSDDYIRQSIHEIENLKLREVIIPPQNTNNLGADGAKVGKPKKDDATNDNTIQSQAIDSGNTPKANV